MRHGRGVARPREQPPFVQVPQHLRGTGDGVSSLTMRHIMPWSALDDSQSVHRPGHRFPRTLPSSLGQQLAQVDDGPGGDRRGIVQRRALQGLHDQCLRGCGHGPGSS